MSRRSAQSSGASSVAPAADLPNTGDFDGVDPDGVEVRARGAALEAGRPFVLKVDIPLEMDVFRAIAQAAQAEGLDTSEYVQRAVRRLGEALCDSR